MEQDSLNEESLSRLKDQILDDLDYIGRGFVPVVYSEFISGDLETNSFIFLCWCLDYANNTDAFGIPIDVYKEVVKVKVKSPNLNLTKEDSDHNFDYDSDYQTDSFRINDSSLPFKIRAKIHDHIIFHLQNESVGQTGIENQYSYKDFEHHSQEISDYIHECIEAEKKRALKQAEAEETKRKEFSLFEKDDPNSLISESSIPDSFNSKIGKGVVIVSGINPDKFSFNYGRIHGFMSRVKKIRKTNPVVEVRGIFAGTKIKAGFAFCIFDIDRKTAIDLIGASVVSVGIYISQQRDFEIVDLLYNKY